MNNDQTILAGRQIKALGLCSGGLDSILAAYILIRQGIRVEWITFETPFFSSKNALAASRNSKIPLTVKNITDVYVKMLKNPGCGYGKRMNPCMDCHALMFRLAGKVMRDRGFDFLFSGEVLGQRPMSQTGPSLRYVEKRSQAEGYILRPLSAKKLPETILELKGLVNRDLLLDISGRSRSRQIELAKEFNIVDYPSPAGGCLLTDKEYCVRLKDLFEFQKDFTQKSLYLLKYGRHFRIDPKFKIIVGRTNEENIKIKEYAGNSILIEGIDYPGPTCLVSKNASENIIKLASCLCVGYSKAPDNTGVRVKIKAGDKEPSIIYTKGIPPKEVKQKLIRSKN